MLNTTSLIGNLVKDSSHRVTQNGTDQVTYRVAVNDTYFSQGEKQERTDFFNVVMWGKRGKGLHDKGCLQKGQQVAITGKLRSREFGEGKDRKYFTEIHVSDIDLLRPPKRQREEADPGTDPSDPGPAGGDFAE